MFEPPSSGLVQHQPKYSPPRRGGVDAPSIKMDPFRNRARPGWSVRRNRWDAGLTTPSAPLRWLRGILLVAQPPLLCEEGTVLARKTCQKYKKQPEIFLFVPFCDPHCAFCGSCPSDTSVP